MKKLYSLLLFNLCIYGFTQAQITTQVLQQMQITCHGMCNGTAFIVTTGGVPPYMVTGSFTNSPQIYNSVVTLTGFCAGTHPLLVTDANGASTAVIVTFTQPPQLTASAYLAGNATSPTNCDGAISGGLLSNGTPPHTYQWIDCNTNTALPGQNMPNAGGLCVGSYALVVVDANGCVDTSNCVNVSAPSSLSDINMNDIQIYPNPGNGEIFIKLPIFNNIVLANVNLYDITGRLIYNQAINSQNMNLNLSNLLNNGIYQLQINYGDKIFTEKIIVQK